MFRLFVGFSLFCFVQGLQVYNWTVDRNFLTADCVPKLQLTVNGIFPGPEIRVPASEEIVVNIYNALPTESVTVHWHGQEQLDTAFMDGINKISQCPIGPYSSFTYRFHVNDESGTYFYHIHAGALVESGCYGSLIITDIDDNDNDYNEEFTMIIADHYHLDSNSLSFGLLSQSFRWVYDPNNILINGKGIYNCTNNDDYTCNDNVNGEDCVDSNNNHVCSANERYYTTNTNYFDSCLENSCNFEMFNVSGDKGNTFLFRIINPSPLSHLNVIFECHEMKIISIDARAVIPITVDSIDLHSGQRADVLVTFNDNDSSCDNDYSFFWISVKIRSRSGQRTGNAVLRYNGNDEDIDSVESIERRTEVDSMHPAWDDYDYTRDQQNNFEGYSDAPDSSSVDSQWILLTTQERFDLDNNDRFNGNDENFDVRNLESIIGTESSYRPENNCDSSYYLRWAFNRQTFKMPDTPLLLQNKFNYNKFESNIMENNLINITYFKVKKGHVYDMILQNYPACNGVCETHPIHLHGHKFWVLGHFKGEWNNTLEQRNELCQNNCPIRDSAWLIGDDTVPFEAGTQRGGCGYTYIRFIANSPGVWPIHCHQSWHFLMGKIAIIYYDESEIELPSNINTIDLCGNDVNFKHVYDTYYNNPSANPSGKPTSNNNGGWWKVSSPTPRPTKSKYGWNGH